MARSHWGGFVVGVRLVGTFWFQSTTASHFWLVCVRYPRLAQSPEMSSLYRAGSMLAIVFVAAGSLSIFSFVEISRVHSSSLSSLAESGSMILDVFVVSSRFNGPNCLRCATMVHSAASAAWTFPQ